MSAKVLIYDLETSPNIGYCWGKWDQNIPAFIKESHLMCFSYKWLDAKQTHVKALCDYKGYKGGIMEGNDKPLVEDLWRLFDEADIVVAHNGAKFDQKVARTKFILNGLAPPAPYKYIDTLQHARRLFKFNSNKLDDLGQILGLGRKVSHEGMGLWIKCMEGDKSAWKRMKAYAKQDAVLLENVYYELRPWITTGPNLGIYEENPMHRCPRCSSTNIQKRGFARTNTAVYQQYWCKDCGAWHRSAMAEKSLGKTTQR